MECHEFGSRRHVPVRRIDRKCSARSAGSITVAKWLDWRSFDLVVAAGRAAGLSLINTAVWNKGSGGMGGLYRSGHELIPVFCKGKSPRVNNVELGKHGRDRTNVWSYPGANRRGTSAGDALKHHPTPKPVEMVHDAIIDVTNPGEIVLDPFLGSGTTLLAAERAGRIACCIELDPRYVDVAILRWEAETGRSAIHEETGRTFDELRELRSGADADDG
jgi:DNA modification methylase